MRKTYDEIKEHLTKIPKARERKNKNKFIAWLIQKKYKPEALNDILIVESLVLDVSSYDRTWRQVLQHEPHLRGSDYDEKKALEQAKELELGYTPGYDEDIEKGKTL